VMNSMNTNLAGDVARISKVGNSYTAIVWEFGLNSSHGETLRRALVNTVANFGCRKWQEICWICKRPFPLQEGLGPWG
jgi:hypothetical protein